ncbi:hypothetical protein [Microbacterium sp. Leaf151]|uniref:hypothetical protein n=1 Tax=Microbacterium sp. Leaf151 TaxID=1736276 RepID=UPI0012E380C2|nr:hypothetical protein [Microbacterium sp. Leaf151]
MQEILTAADLESGTGGPSLNRDGAFVVSRGARSLEISSPSETAKAILGPRLRSLSLKLKGFEAHQHDEAMAVLDRHGQSFLFDLDVRYNLGFTLGRKRSSVQLRPADPVKRAPAFPRNGYALEALALYQYGRQAAGLPLLEFLAYYQAVEFFFPSFAHAETASRIRAHILHPRFEADDDKQVAALIELARPAVQSGASERDQLRATVRASTTNEALREVIAGIEAQVGEHFTAKKPPLAGTNRLNVDGDLRDQVADRIYATRCRVVHTKADGGGNQTELLLPTSREAESLVAENMLLRYLAQQVLIAKATALP